MTLSPSPRIFSLPGWQNSEPIHWQTRWQALLGHELVEQDDWQWPRRGDWMARLDDVVGACEAPCVLVAHSLGCHLVAAWATLSQHTGKVQAALLVAPPDTERQDLPPQLYNWRAWSRTALPFVSLVVASSNDLYCGTTRAMEMAAHWGSQFITIGDHGHINALSALGDWPQGQALLYGLLMSSS